MFAATAQAASNSTHIFQVFWSSDPVVKLTLLILIGMSIVCWAIIVFKHKELKHVRIASIRFLEIFLKTKTVEEIARKQAHLESPLTHVFRSIVEELSRKIDIHRIHRKIDRAVDEEVGKLEKYVPFLATTGSSAPFIGLFGTVWGILSAFWQIGRAGSTSLAVVGPFIAEALIATAFGLAAAIPAVIFYNHFVSRIRELSKEIQGFGDELVDRIEREMT
jgi:biopolymer transport protein TolQ